MNFRLEDFVRLLFLSDMEVKCLPYQRTKRGSIGSIRGNWMKKNGKC